MKKLQHFKSTLFKTGYQGHKSGLSVSDVHLALTQICMLKLPTIHVKIIIHFEEKVKQACGQLSTKPS